jgi:hypothetical protein
MSCPYLRVGRLQNYCDAYLGRLMVPSLYEEEHFCGTCSHTECVWFVSRWRAEESEDGMLRVAADRVGDEIPGDLIGFEAILN